MAHTHSGETRGHGHEGHLAARAPERRRLVIALVLTTAVLVVELAGGLISRSMAQISDAAHVLTDISAQALALFALVLAARPADTRRTYGYYRLEILSALANGVILVGIAAVLGYEAWRRLRAPAVVDARVMLATAGAGLVINLAGARLLHGAESLNVKGAYLHVVGDVFASTAVVTGAVLMLVSSRLQWVDPVISMVIAAVIVVSALSLIRAAVDVLLEAVPAHVDLARVSGDLARIAGVLDVHDLHIWTITSGMYALSVHLVIAEGEAAAPCDALLTSVKEMLLREHHIAHSTLQIESSAYEHAEHVH